jgi:hypothetical protein
MVDAYSGLPIALLLALLVAVLLGAAMNRLRPR